MSRINDLGEILEWYERREHSDRTTRKPDVKVWEEIQRYVEEKGAGNKLHMLTVEAKNAVYQAYESAKKAGLTDPYTFLLADRLTNGKDMKEIERWAKSYINYIKMCEKSM